ncbi:MAG: porin family protein [Gammaproteobacteria bacterium]|nr:porin family protein [Gammaproteobacteria bacterium]
MKSIVTIMLIFLGFLSFSATAGALYVDVSLVRTTMKIEGEKLNPFLARYKLGYQLSNQLAIEAQFAKSAKEDDLNNLDVDVDEFNGYYVRYSGDSAYNGVTLYFIAGVSTTKLKWTRDGNSNSETFEDFSYGIGAEEHSEAIKNMVYTFEYMKYYDSNDLDVSGISLGIRYNF